MTKSFSVQRDRVLSKCGPSIVGITQVKLIPSILTQLQVENELSDTFSYQYYSSKKWMGSTRCML